MNARHFLKKQHESAQGLVEYALILVLVAVVVIVVLLQLGPAVGNTFSTLMTYLNFEQNQDSGACVVAHSDFGSITVPETVLNGNSNHTSGGVWNWTGANLRYEVTNRVVYNAGWVNGASASGDCSPLG